MIELAVTALSVRNQEHRENNEDAVSVFGFLAPPEADSPISLSAPLGEARLVLVADGMGGHAAGEVASREVATFLEANKRALLSEEELVNVLQSADQRLLDLMAADGSREGMGTTVAGFVTGEDRAVVFNVGDSRIYRYWDRRLLQLSIDDWANAVTETAPTGGIRWFIGGGTSERPSKRLDPNLREISLAHGDRFMLCTDGVSDTLETEDMESVFRLERDDQTLALELVNRAYFAGSRDNLSVVLLRAIDRSGEPIETRAPSVAPGVGIGDTEPSTKPNETQGSNTRPDTAGHERHLQVPVGGREATGLERPPSEGSRRLSVGRLRPTSSPSDQDLANCDTDAAAPRRRRLPKTETMAVTAFLCILLLLAMLAVFVVYQGTQSGGLLG